MNNEIRRSKGDKHGVCDGWHCNQSQSKECDVTYSFVDAAVLWSPFSVLFLPHPMSLQLTEFVKRPGVGKVGKPVRVRSNFFEVTSFPTGNIHHYDVTIDPPSAPPALYRKVWKAFEDQDGQGVLTGIKAVFDGRKNAFSPKPLALGEEQAKAFNVSFRLVFQF